MGWSLTENVAEFDAATHGYLAADPIRNTVALTLVASLRAHDGRASGVYDNVVFGYYVDAATVRAAFVHTAPHPLHLVTCEQTPAVELARLILARGHPLTAVAGPAEAVSAFADTLADLAGRRSRLGGAERLYRLEHLTPATPRPPGGARIATANDRELLIRWYEEFGRDAGVPGTRAGRRQAVEAGLGAGSICVWEDDGGGATAFAACRPVIEGTSRVGPVYTAPEHRGRGYGAAVTEAVTRRAWQLGARDVVLFADLANNTSNALYRRLGYRPVADRITVNIG